MDPYFVQEQGENSLSRNLSVHTGQKAYLECRVRNLGAKRVRNLLTRILKNQALMHKR